MEHRLLALVLINLLMFGCATQPAGTKIPLVESTTLDSTLITPKIVRFNAKISIKNQMENSLPLEKVEYSVELNGKQLFNASFDGLLVTPSMGEQKVNFPFRIAYKDILNLPPNILQEGLINVKFKGNLHTNKDLRLKPVPFEINQEFPIPRIPVVTLSNKSSPFKKNLKLVFEVDNKNFFPLDISKIDYYMEVDNKKYDLSKSNKTKNIKAKSSGELVLKINKKDKQSKSAYSTIKKSKQYQLLGSIEYKTPYGIMQAPLELKVEK